MQSASYLLTCDSRYLCSLPLRCVCVFFYVCGRCYCECDCYFLSFFFLTLSFSGSFFLSFQFVMKIWNSHEVLWIFFRLTFNSFPLVFFSPIIITRKKHSFVVYFTRNCVFLISFLRLRLRFGCVYLLYCLPVWCFFFLHNSVYHPENRHLSTEKKVNSPCIQTHAHELAVTNFVIARIQRAKK